MVFKHNKQPFDSDESYQLAYKHLSQLDSRVQLTSSAEISSYGCIPENQLISDGEKEYVLSQSLGEVRPRGDEEFEKITAVTTPNDNSATVPGNTSSVPWVISSTTRENVSSEHGKRPFSDDKSYNVTCKRTRQMGENSELGSFTEIPPFSSSYEESPISDTADKEFENRKDAAVSKDSGKTSSGSIFSLPWFTCSRSEEDMRLELPVRLSFPGYYGDDYRAYGFNHVEEIRSPVFDYHPRKLVAVGPNHQADVPVCRSQCYKNSNGESDGRDTCSTSSVHFLTDEDNSDKWVGACVMPMLDSDTSVLDVQVGQCKTDCCCLDEGSIRCVKQHVREARDKLRKTLGHNSFEELGFSDMGEDVALRWTEEEEQLFQEVVLSNPASLGKNFWDDLPQAFPFRSSKELVSYYFNVFMLRKRAEQNRSDPLNVDSDNDEWQESDDGEFAMSEEEEEDSGVESPLEGDDVAHSNDGYGEEDIHEEADDGYDCDDHDLGGEDDNEGLYNKSKFGPSAGLLDKSLQDSAGEDHDVQDDSCTSYEGQHNGADSGGHANVLETHDSWAEDDHENLHDEYRNDGMSDMTDHEYIVGHCDPKPWEIGYIQGTGKDIDFLPTCNVIEEVFGKESLENETTEGHGIS